MLTNYHTHTYRCKHAVGKEDEYVAVALAEGYDALGFTDHVILPGIQGRVRGDWGTQEEYFSSLRRLQEEYKGQIDIFVGHECEWSSRFASYYKELLDSKKVDYLIFGNHTLYFKGGKDIVLKIRSHTEYVRRYRKFALAALESGLFSYMAHPDFYMSYSPWDGEAERTAIEICKNAKKRDIVLELNCSCLRWKGGERDLFGEHRVKYPYPKFWEIAREVGNTVVIGVDAHDPLDLQKEKRELTLQFAADMGLHVVDHLDFIQKRI